MFNDTTGVEAEQRICNGNNNNNGTSSILPLALLLISACNNDDGGLLDGIDNCTVMLLLGIYFTCCNKGSI